MFTNDELTLSQFMKYLKGAVKKFELEHKEKIEEDAEAWGVMEFEDWCELFAGYVGSED